MTNTFNTMRRAALFLTPILISLVILFIRPAVCHAEEKATKTGLNLGVLPAVSFNSDEGFQYGVILNLFNYGDGSRFPGYDYSAYLEASTFTRGSSLLRLYFDSDKILPGIRSFIDASYIQEDLMPFYGFNGYQSVYSADTLGQNRTFYSMSQRQYRLMTDFTGKLGNSKLNWLFSYAFYQYTPGEVDFNKLNKDVDATDPDYLHGTSLYKKYLDWGIIDANQANGGSTHAIKAGLVYDTRNALINPSQGICTEVLLELAPAFINKLPYTRYSVVHRQYHELIKERLNLAIRIGAQGKIGSNDIPFYRLTQLISPFATRSNVTGLGGDNSLRGILKNRIVGEGMAYSNIELRWKAITFEALKQHFYVGFNGFVDLGMVTDPIDVNLGTVSLSDQSIYFSQSTDQSLHTSLGGGLKLAMNENFVVSVDMGKAIDERDGDGLGTYIKINYLF
jgi:outer membrane protein assembly factor BamA